LVDSGDEAIGDGANHFFEVRLGGEDINCGLRRYQDIVGREVGEISSDGVEWDGEMGRGQRRGGGRLIGGIDRQHRVVEKSEGGVDRVVEVCVWVVEGQDDVGNGG
jgi:hypothetical protein